MVERQGLFTACGVLLGEFVDPHEFLAIKFYVFYEVYFTPNF